jgi:hypothetical protein
MLSRGLQLDLPQSRNRPRRLLTQIKGDIGRSAKLHFDDATSARAMFYSGELKDELQALKDEVSRLLNTTGVATAFRRNPAYLPRRGGIATLIQTSSFRGGSEATEPRFSTCEEAAKQPQDSGPALRAPPE